MRAKLALPIALALVGAAALLMQFGYFGPLSARVRGLFVKHTRTGNPLVDSVAEHQPANEQADTTASTTSVSVLAVSLPIPMRVVLRRTPTTSTTSTTSRRTASSSRSSASPTPTSSSSSTPAPPTSSQTRWHRSAPLLGRLSTIHDSLIKH